MIKKLSIFFFILIANFAFCQDQEATIFFNDGSSIKGFGSIKKNEIIFRVTLDDKPDSWSYDMAKGITFLGFESTIKYEYVKLDEFSKPKPQLLEVVEEGSVTLYASVKRSFQNFNVRSGGGGFNSGLNTNLGFNNPISNLNILGGTPDIVSYRSSRGEVDAEIYVKRIDEEYPTSLNGSFYKKAKKYFSDCEVINKKIDKGEFSKNKILEIVQYYNDICAE
ncbi:MULTISPECIES: hypothetical protein [unclassified Flavobacterium]|uniref:hypothetical protein n=1 Tax=unclassified Flavobacterium TaxID=196869 RepID=UPI0025BC5368|nr:MULTISPECIES: hypothetical protein [unclassified Flavobacterium]